ncbi:hypothetical protein H4Q26_009692 [Puccinia striiformis f. sp. tritici PST-130]|nr:hypothetical protein H4Q26_009692 [Puccinia striiformis f. sp. tritici PST-130]
MYALGPLSGGHINPFITLATMASGTLPLVRGAAYIVAHMLGSMVGGALVAAALGPGARNTSNGGCILRSEDSFRTGVAHQQIQNHGIVWPLFCLDYPSASCEYTLWSATIGWIT